MQYLFNPPVIPTLKIANRPELYPVNRIFCVGRNYATHAKEMGVEVDRESPFYFTKSASAVCTSDVIHYPSGTSNYQHEVELAVMLGMDMLGMDMLGMDMLGMDMLGMDMLGMDAPRANAHKIHEEEADNYIFGYAVALDMTRRDLQAKAKEKRYPWDTAKDVEESAVFAPILEKEKFTPSHQVISLSVDGAEKQRATLDELIWPINTLIADLSHYYHLKAGDVILTGTPSGVGPVSIGNTIEATIDGLPPLKVLCVK